MTQINFDNLRMSIYSIKDGCELSFEVASGLADYNISIPITDDDFEIIKTDSQRAAFLISALHHPFQLEETRLNEQEQRHYLDMILHAPINKTESFLTNLDNGSANGAISNMVRITTGENRDYLRPGQWFIR